MPIGLTTPIGKGRVQAQKRQNFPRGMLKARYNLQIVYSWVEGLIILEIQEKKNIIGSFSIVLYIAYNPLHEGPKTEIQLEKLMGV